MSFNTTSFPGFHGGSQCGICHNEPAVAWNPAYASESIVVDGNTTEAVWAEADDNNMYIPIASGFGFGGSYTDVNGTDIEVPYFVKFQVSQNSSHIFFNARLEDVDGVQGDDSRYADADAFALIFNINMDEFALPRAWEPMASAVATDGSQDVVFWQPTTAATGVSDALWNATSDEYDSAIAVPSAVYDGAYGATEGSQDWSAGAIHGYIADHYETHYSVEMSRPLVTGDAGDVQFQYDGYYEFALAYWNDTKGAGHWVSFEHTLWVHGADGAMPLDKITVTADGVTVTEAGADVTVTETEESPLSLFASLFGLFTISMAVMVFRRKE